MSDVAQETAAPAQERGERKEQGKEREEEEEQTAQQGEDVEVIDMALVSIRGGVGVGNAYVRATVGIEPEQVTGVHKLSASVSEGQDWLEELEFYLDPEHEGEQYLHLELVAKNRLRRDAVISAMDLPISGLEPNKQLVYDQNGLGFTVFLSNSGEPGGDNVDAGLNVTKLDAEAQAAADAEREAELQARAAVVIKPGPYRVHVHVIEARALKGEDLEGTSDAMASVKVLGQAQHTGVVKDCTSAVWDELMVFNLADMDSDKLEQAEIVVEVMDVDPLSNDLIGLYSFDVLDVYLKKNHEMRNTWVAVIDPRSDDDSGVQGYVKLSVCVLGPDDTLVLHDEDDEGADSDNDGDEPQVLMPPVLKRELRFLCLTVFRAHDLPQMDASLGPISTGGINAYVQVDFGGNKPIRTSVRTAKGSSNLDVVYNEELWIPVLVPTMSNRITVTLWDHDAMSKDDLVATLHFNFKDVQRGRMLPAWCPLWGAAANAKSEAMNRTPNKASTYRGKLLLSMKEVCDPGKTLPEKIFVKKAKGAVRRSHTETTDYRLQALVLRAQDLPEAAGSSAAVRVSIGEHQVATPSAQVRDGMVRWQTNTRALLEAGDLALPANAASVPDVAVHLLGANGKPICFARVKASALLEASAEPQAQWLYLEADSSVGAVPGNEFPGSLLVALRLMPEQEVESAPWDVATLVRGMTDETYELRAHVFQARDLPAADHSGALDPYALLTYCGKRAVTDTKPITTCPLWYNTLSATVRLPRNLALAPAVALSIWDADQYTSDDQVGSLRVPLDDVVLTCEATGEHFRSQEALKAHRETPAYKAAVARQNQEASERARVRRAEAAATPVDTSFSLSRVLAATTMTSTALAPTPGEAYADSGLPQPQWRQLEGCSGEVLISLQLIPVTHSSPRAPVPSLVPATRACFVEVLALGVRDMKPYQQMPIQMPFLVIDAGSRQSDQTLRTQPSRQPSGPSANFLSKMLMPIDLPEDPLFAPALNVRVFDSRLGGLVRPQIGFASVALNTKMYWSPEYVPPHAPSAATSAEGGEEEGEEEAKGAAEEAEVEQRARPAKLSWPDSDDDSESDSDSEDEGAAGGDDESDLPEYLRGRRVVKKELEASLGCLPFETYTVYRAVGLTTMRRKPVGAFKGIIRVVASAQPDPLVDAALLKPTQFVVRLYVLDAVALTPKDRDGSSDPFLCVRLGGQKIWDASEHHSDTLSPKFHRVFELPASLPGASALQVEVWDYNRVAPCEMIGATTIDLEDRLFSQEWTDMGADLETPRRYRPKPLEWRSLHVPMSQQSQGQLGMWLEILPVAAAKRYELVDIAIPPPEKFELRCVVWGSKKVPAGDELTGYTDMFVKAKLEGRAWQETDTHWRCSSGKGSFNWRFVFPLELPDKFPYLTLQVWDKDLVYNDMIGETTLDLGKYCRAAMREGTSINVASFQKQLKQRKQQQQDPEKASLLPQSRAGKGEPSGLERIKQFMGLAVPEDARWYKLGHQDPESGKVKPAGSLMMTIEVVPAAESAARPAGIGRSEPNANPELPKPTGRLELSALNPLKLLSEIFSPQKVFFCVCCCCLCAVITLIIFVAMFAETGLSLGQHAEDDDA